MDVLPGRCSLGVGLLVPGVVSSLGSVLKCLVPRGSDRGEIFMHRVWDSTDASILPIKTPLAVLLHITFLRHQNLSSSNTQRSEFPRRPRSLGLISYREILHEMMVLVLHHPLPAISSGRTEVSADLDCKSELNR